MIKSKCQCMKNFALILLMIFNTFRGQEILEKYPKSQTPYKGGYEQYYKDLYFFLEFIEDHHFKTDFEEISFKDLTLQQIFDRLNNLKHKNNEAPYLSVIINDWKIIDLRDFNNEKEAFTSLKSYLEQEKLLNDSDRLCWDIYIDNI